MEATSEGVKARSVADIPACLRVIPEFAELSSLSSPPDVFKNTPVRNY